MPAPSSPASPDNELLRFKQSKLSGYARAHGTRKRRMPGWAAAALANGHSVRIRSAESNQVRIPAINRTSPGHARIPGMKRANSKTAVVWLKRLPLPLYFPVGVGARTRPRSLPRPRGADSSLACCSRIKERSTYKSAGLTLRWLDLTVL